MDARFERYIEDLRTVRTLSRPKFSPDMKMLSRATSRMTAQTTAIFEESFFSSHFPLPSHTSVGRGNAM